MKKIFRNLSILFLLFYYLLIFYITPNNLITWSYIADFSKHHGIHLLAFSFTIATFIVYLLVNKYVSKFGNIKYKRKFIRLLNYKIFRYLFLFLLVFITSLIIFIPLSILSNHLFSEGKVLSVFAGLVFWCIMYPLNKDLCAFIKNEKLRSIVFILITIFLGLISIILLTNEDYQTFFYNASAQISIITVIVILSMSKK